MSAVDYTNFDPRIPKYPTIISSILSIILVLMYLIEIYFNASYNDQSLIMLGAKWNEGIIRGEFWRFFTPTLLHGNIFHLLLNLTALLVFGKEVESIYGPISFCILFIFSSWGAILCSFVFSDGIAIGASGALFGIIGALLVFYYKNKDKISGAILKYKSIYTMILINLIFGILIPKIDNFAHIGGLITGISLSSLITPTYIFEQSTDNRVTLKHKDKTFKKVLASLLSLFTLSLLTLISIKNSFLLNFF